MQALTLTSTNMLVILIHQDVQVVFGQLIVIIILVNLVVKALHLELLLLELVVEQ